MPGLRRRTIDTAIAMASAPQKSEVWVRKSMVGCQ
jgi:hypothetical protein